MKTPIEEGKMSNSLVLNPTNQGYGTGLMVPPDPTQARKERFKAIAGGVFLGSFDDKGDADAAVKDYKKAERLKQLKMLLISNPYPAAHAKIYEQMFGEKLISQAQFTDKLDDLSRSSKQDLKKDPKLRALLKGIYSKYGLTPPPDILGESAALTTQFKQIGLGEDGFTSHRDSPNTNLSQANTYEGVWDRAQKAFTERKAKLALTGQLYQQGWGVGKQANLYA